MSGTTSIPSVLRREDVSAMVRDEMFALLTEHFQGVTRAQFECDLDEKNRVILLRHESRLVGFTTLLAYESCFDGGPVSVVYSGDTIVAREAWGSPALSRAWIATVNHLRETLARGPFYWLLLTSGFRTYRFLPVFWREFWPRFDAKAPEEHQRLIDHLAIERFGSQYDPGTGLVRFRQPQQLRADMAQVPAGRLNDPHIAFFLKRNPRHADGDELVCLTELSPGNLTRAGRRMVEEFGNGHEPYTIAG
jgi:hypothetical protein